MKEFAPIYSVQIKKIICFETFYFVVFTETSKERSWP